MSRDNDRVKEIRMTKSEFLRRYEKLQNQARRQQLVIVLSDAGNLKYVFHNTYKKHLFKEQNL